MSRYIDADLLRKEIEKRIHICYGVYERDSDTYYQGKAVAYQETLSIIDSLQQEQPCDTCTNDKGCVACKDGELWEGKEQPSKFLEKEIKRYLQEEHNRDTTVRDVARHFANWQKEQMGEQARKELFKDNLTLADLVAFDEGCKLGRRLERQDMLKGAVNARVTYRESIPGGSYIEIVADIPNPTGVRYKDEVKVIIVKEGEE